MLPQVAVYMVGGGSAHDEGIYENKQIERRSQRFSIYIVARKPPGHQTPSVAHTRLRK